MKTSILNTIKTSATIICFMLFASCISAQTESEYRTVTDFTGIKAGGAFEITLKQGAAQGIRVEAEQKMLNKIRTEVKEGVLNIYTDGRTEINSPVRIYVTVKELKSLDMGGACKIKGETVFASDKISINTSGAARIDIDVKTSELNITAAGAGSIEVAGTASKLKANISGASYLNTFGLETSSVSVEASGASSAKVNAGKEINADASGASSINYKGEPDTKNISKSGSSFIRKDS